MTGRLLAAVLWITVIQSPSLSTDSTSDNGAFTRDFEEIERLGQVKNPIGLENMVETLKSRWKDSDMDLYCRLMDRLCGRLRTDFDTRDEKMIEISDDVLSELQRKLDQGIDPIFVRHYYIFQGWHIAAANGTYYTSKKEMPDENWTTERKEVFLRLFNAWKLIQDAKDPNWNIDITFSAKVQPPNGVSPGISPDSIGDPGLREKYEADIKQNDDKKRWWDAQYRLSQTEDQLKKRLLNDIKVMYNTPPLVPDELKGLLDTYVKDEGQKKMFLEASQKQEQ